MKKERVDLIMIKWEEYKPIIPRVKRILKIAFSLLISTSIILALIDLGIKDFEKKVDKKFALIKKENQELKEETDSLKLTLLRQGERLDSLRRITLLANLDQYILDKILMGGELIEFNSSDFKQRIKRELLLILQDKGQIRLWYIRSGRYFPYIEQVCRLYSLPSILKYLFVIESSLVSDIRSYSGAVGLGQLIWETAIEHGRLIINWEKGIDQRLDPELNIKTSLKYSRYLYFEFENWPLSLLSYNGDPEVIVKNIKKQKTGDFRKLRINKETDRFFAKFIAAMIIFETKEIRELFRIKVEEMLRPLEYDTVKVRLYGDTHLSEVAKACGTDDFRLIYELNPSFFREEIPQRVWTKWGGWQDIWTLRIPPGTKKKFIENFKKFGKILE